MAEHMLKPLNLFYDGIFIPGVLFSSTQKDMQHTCYYLWNFIFM